MSLAQELRDKYPLPTLEGTTKQNEYATDLIDRALCRYRSLIPSFLDRFNEEKERISTEDMRSKLMNNGQTEESCLKEWADKLDSIYYKHLFIIFTERYSCAIIYALKDSFNSLPNKPTKRYY